MEGGREVQEHEEEDEDEEEILVDEAAVEPGRDGSDHAEENHENPRMKLSPQEREWALAIKAAVVSDPELDDLSDFFYAQLALVDKEDVQAAVERAHKIQYFRQEYRIVDTTQVAMKYLEENLELLPGVYLSFSWIQEHGRYVMVVDLSKMDGGVLRQQPKAKTTFMISDYYMGHMMCPDLEAIRKGVFILAECEGFSWSQHFGLDFFRQTHDEISSVYPMNFENIKLFHTGLAINLLMSMAQKIVPFSVHSKLQVGCISCYGRLDTLYLVPSLEATNQRFLIMARACLDKYYANSASFSLD